MDEIFVRVKQKPMREHLREGRLVWNTTYPIYNFLLQKVNIRTGVIQHVCAEGLASEMNCPPREMSRHLKTLVRNNYIRRFFAVKGNSEQVIIIDRFEIANKASAGVPRIFDEAIVIADLCDFTNRHNMSENTLTVLWEFEKFKAQIPASAHQKLKKFEQNALFRIRAESGRNRAGIWPESGRNLESISSINDNDLRTILAEVLPKTRRKLAEKLPKFRLFSAVIKEIEEIEELKNLKKFKNSSPISPPNFNLNPSTGQSLSELEGVTPSTPASVADPTQSDPDGITHDELDRDYTLEDPLLS
jgi:hypothetical protein